MNSPHFASPHHVAIASDAAFGVILAFVGGLVIAGVLVWMVRLGIKKRRAEPGPPRPGSHPVRPGPAHAEETREIREPNEVPRAAGDEERLTPHDLGPGSKRSARSDSGNRPRWNRDSSGSFGSGGPGST
jgi:hypothetical protein